MRHRRFRVTDFAVSRKFTIDEEFRRMSDFPNRTYCDTLHEMRDILKTATPETWKTSVNILLSLVEECQVYGNRMEAGLEYGHDLRRLHETRRELTKKVAELKSKVGEDEDADL